jgi:glycosyltransferase involved in cell wall biosynthesis
MMKVSIIIPVYNEYKNIGTCLASLSRQTYKNFEIVIVDDESEDNSKLKVQSIKLQLKSQNLQILEQKHKGAGAARNLGAKHAKGEILVFVDADMTFKEDFIEKLVDPILKGKVIGTFSKDEFLSNKDNIWAICWNLNRGLPANRMQPLNHPDHQKVFRAILKKKFEEVGGFDEKAGYSDDWSLSQKLGVEAIVAKGAVFYHKNPESLSEVYVQSKWAGKRRYKLGVIGYLIALVRVSLPISILLGLLYAVSYKLYAFFLFKIVSDFGQFVGILEYVLLKKVSR